MWHGNPKVWHWNPKEWHWNPKWQHVQQSANSNSVRDHMTHCRNTNFLLSSFPKGTLWNWKIYLWYLWWQWNPKWWHVKQSANSNSVGDHMTNCRNTKFVLSSFPKGTLWNWKMFNYFYWISYPFLLCNSYVHVHRSALGEWSYLLLMISRTQTHRRLHLSS